MNKIFLYADEASQKILSGESQKIIAIGSDFGYGNFGDVLQHINALKAIKAAGRYDTISVMAANAISHQKFPSWALSAYKTDAVVFVADYPLVLSDSDPRLNLVGEIRNVAGVCLYGGGFLNAMWGDFVLSVVEHFLHRNGNIDYWVSGQQITAPFEKRVVDHINTFRPKLFGVRDEVSLQLLAEQGFTADYSFDDAAEALLELNHRFSVQQGQGLALHLNSSDYTANRSLEHGLGKELATLANYAVVDHEITVFQAFKDTRQDVFDTAETIKRLDYLFPFHVHRTVDLVGLLFDQSVGKDALNLDVALGYSCSYHVALWLQLAGIPCWLRSSNSFYDQKSRALQVTQELEEFLQSPKLADHRSNIARRANWSEKLQKHLQSIQHINNCLIFEEIEDGPAPWPFYYKGQPTLQDKLVEAEQITKWHRERAEEIEHDSCVIKGENAELHGRVEALSAQLTEVGNEVQQHRARAEGAERDLGMVKGENTELHGRLEALSAQLTEVGNEAHQQRARAEGTERDLGMVKGENAELNGRLGVLRSENAELLGRIEELSTQLSAVFASRSWRLTRGLRVFGRLSRGEFDLLGSSIRQRFKRDR